VARYEVLIKPSARKELEAVGLKKDRQRIVAAILALAEEPRPIGSRKLSGRDKYRIRYGDYRVVYSIQDVVLVVTIAQAGHHLDVCRYAARSRSAGSNSVGTSVHPEHANLLRPAVFTAHR